MSEINQDYIEKLFVKYAKVNTRIRWSQPSSSTTPGQVALAKLVTADLKKLGVAKVNLMKPMAMWRGLCQVIPTNQSVRWASLPIWIPPIFSGPCKATVHPNYDGQDIVLNEAKQIVLKASEFPNLKKFVGQRLITSDGQLYWAPMIKLALRRYSAHRTISFKINCSARTNSGCVWTRWRNRAGC